jgi:hypothetical protein
MLAGLLVTNRCDRSKAADISVAGLGFRLVLRALNIRGKSWSGVFRNCRLARSISKKTEEICR